MLRRVKDFVKNSLYPLLPFIFIFFVVSYIIYEFAMGPIRTVDALKAEINRKVVSPDYRRGWLDCVSFLYNLTVGPSNMTGDGL